MGEIARSRVGERERESYLYGMGRKRLSKRVGERDKTEERDMTLLRKRERDKEREREGERDM